jgi:hypothetical protein
MIWAILAPEYEEIDAGFIEDVDEDGPTNLVQIDTPKKPS